MARLIDADALADNIAVLFERNKALIDEWLMYHVEDAIDEAPTIEAEPVVRCKDCHYAKPYNKIWQLPKRDTLVCTHFANDEVDNNFFCGYAIKKMEEVNEE